MKTMFFSLVLVLGAMNAAAAEHTWTGKISDDTCGANHQKGAEHGAKAMSDHDCTGVPGRIFADKHRELLQEAMVQIRERLRDLKGQRSTVKSTGKEKYKDAHWNPGGCVSRPRTVNPAAIGESAAPKISSAGGR